MKIEQFLDRLDHVKKSGDEWIARCPSHDDSTPSLSIKEGEDGKIVLKCFAGCATESIVANLGLNFSDLFNSKPEHNGHPRKIVATYPYADEQGKVLFEVVRFDPKDFRQRAPDGNWSVKGIRRVPFHLPELLDAIKAGRPAYIAEGEKDVIALEAAGFAATCNPGGAGKWLREFGQHFSGAEVIIIADKDEPGRKHAAGVAAKLEDTAASVKVIELPTKDAADFFAAGGQAAELDALVETAAPWPSNPNPVLELVQQREFNPNIPPPSLRTIYSLAKTTICTPGNLTSINAPIKSGKSAALGAMSAAAMPHKAGADLLGFQSSNPKSLGVVLFDTEQSPDDFWHCNARSIRRAGLTLPPSWFHAYSLTGLGYKQAWELFIEALKIVADKHGGMHSILIDGVADVANNVNDPAESNALVATLHGLAIQYDCPIIGVIHFNPGSEKSRGHLGSQLERKSETNLALEKDSDETTVIYSTKNRRAGIPKNLGPRFVYSPEAGMHVSVESRRSCREAAERESLLALATEAYNGRPAMRYSELQTTVKKLLTVSDRTAERKVSAMCKLSVIKQSVVGLYTIGEATTV